MTNRSSATLVMSLAQITAAIPAAPGLLKTGNIGMDSMFGF